MKLTNPERSVLLAALTDHEHVTKGWDDAGEAETRRSMTWALKLRIRRELEREPSHRAHRCLQGGEHPEQENLLCYCCINAWPKHHRALPAGILFDNDRGYEGKGAGIMRCDECALFEDDVAAATFLASLLGEPWMKDFDDDLDELPDDPTEEQLRARDALDRPYKPYFTISQGEILKRLAALLASGRPQGCDDPRHGYPTGCPTCVSAKATDTDLEAALYLERDGLRGALKMLRDAIDSEQIADSVSCNVLNAVDLILDRTEP